MSGSGGSSNTVDEPGSKMLTEKANLPARESQQEKKKTLSLAMSRLVLEGPVHIQGGSSHFS